MMTPSNSDRCSRREPENRQLTTTEMEVLGLFRKLLHLVASDETIDLRKLEAVRTSLSSECWYCDTDDEL